MKTLMIVLCLGLLSPFAVAGDKDPADKVEYMQKALQLNDQQTQKIEKILTDARDRKKELANEYTMAQKKEYHEAKKELYKEMKDDISAVLTASQRTAMETMKKAREKMMHDCPHHDKADYKHRKDGHHGMDDKKKHGMDKMKDNS